MDDWLEARRRVSGGKTAMITADRQLTFAEVSERSQHEMLRLLALGVSAGEPVAMLLAPGLDFAVTLHALDRMRAVAVPLGDRLPAADLAAQMRAVGARCLLFDRHHESLATALLPNGRQLGGDAVSLAMISGDGIGSEEDDSRFPEAGLDDDLHSILFTSGTTGAGKGVRLTRANHWWNALGSVLNLGNRDNDMWLACMPLNHVGGLSILIRGVLYGVPVMVHPGFDPQAVNRSIDRGEVTMVSFVTTMLRRVLEERDHRPFPDTLRCVLLGGGPIPSELMDECTRMRIPVAPTYGLTETASQAATMPPSGVVAAPGSVGRSLIGIEVCIDPTDSGAGPGEILVRGPSVSPGYVGPDSVSERRQAGWFPTGDLGHIDADGNLYVSDRRGDLIVTGGENVHPSEVEAVLLAHSDVLDAAVFGLSDKEWGQVVAAAVVVRSESQALSQLDLLKDRDLAPFKRPKRVFLVDEIPRTASGKTLRNLLRERFERS